MTANPARPIPAKLVWLLALLGASVFINYIDRGNLSIAAPMLKDELGVNAAQLGILLSAFFWTYACLQPVYGWLVDRLNVYWLLAGCYLLWSAGTALTGLVHTFAVLFILRLTIGIGEAVMFPAYSKIIALNCSEEQRGMGNAIVMTGISLGPGFGMLLGGTLMARYGWRPFFITLGLASLLWLPLWIRCIPKKVITESRDTSGAPRLAQFLSLRSAWGSCFGLFSANYVNYFLLTWLPFYLTRERNFTMEKMATIGGVAYLVSAGSTIICGALSDRWIRSGGNPSVVRKTFTGGGLAIVSVLLGACAIAPPRLCVVLLIASMVFFGACASNIFAVSQRLAGPQAAGRWVGFQNGFGNLAGVVAPMITGLVVNRTGHFAWAFAVMTVVVLLGAASFLFVIGPLEQVEWGKRSHEPLISAAGNATG